MYKEQQQRIAAGQAASDAKDGEYQGFCPIIHPRRTCWTFYFHVWWRAFKKGMKFYLPIHSAGMLLGGGFKRPVERYVDASRHWQSVNAIY
jgi:hypothetical protein